MGTADHRTGGRDVGHARDGAEPPALRRDDWERPSSPSRAEMAAERIAERVTRTEPGTRLGTKDELRTACGVSVGTFNEALRLLQARGLVTVRPGPGGGLFAAQPPPAGGLDTWARGLDERDPHEALRIRDALDPLLVEDALWHASPADIAELRRHLAVLAEAADAADPVAFADADRRLRTRLAALSPSALLRSLYAGLLAAAGPADPGPEALRTRHDRQAALVDALDARDRDRALRLAATPAGTPEPGDPSRPGATGGRPYPGSGG
ncbi:FadR/GntR family transcriptional regulator [Streptomyces eurocidicus]|uniref:DNA-binding FadR family transcriptional regulator n=1 Tax=Streptomyces eurocidicus TaxID=66423 RepID=A0A7W8BHD6_STREU|nr:FCD domain-containing protein [Streptomyces eurocidicus]MBB5122952.1 DNA-binding FadR family transcriptional regulator [Streptomyces eurocidicus]